ncbi:hydrolase [Streptomyces canarius]|uniref:Hydrolase n=1 Tax=Streptomyces canarius TaxID=285453 RepID=A0ABQ3DFS2_9ACTN|nr:hydrolase [Streptomyces canarius]
MALALGLGGASLAAVGVSDSSPAPVFASEESDCVFPPPNLPHGFTKTFTSRFIDAGGLRQHAYIGGEGPPLLLVHGWPENWYGWRLIMPELAKNFTVIAVDQRGIGLTDKPRGGYDTGTLANDLVALMDALGHQRFAVVGHDTGMSIGYALAADHPERVDRLAVVDSFIPGVTPSPPLVGSSEANKKTYHLGFNRVPEVNEKLVRGREDVYFGFQYDIEAAKSKKLPDYAVKYYTDILSCGRNTLHGSFGWYEALDTTIAQNQRRKTKRLTMPVLGIGGAESQGAAVGKTMKLTADNVQSLVVPGSGHWVAEEAPEKMLAGLNSFLAPYRSSWQSTQTSSRPSGGRGKSALHPE